MEYIYTALLLHKAGKAIDEASVKKVLEAAGITPDDGKVKALIAALSGVNIEEAIQKAAAVAAVPVAAAPASGAEKKEEKKVEKKEEKVDETAAAAGLGALFG
ncbi:MAG: 50S ribosomal protein P1 [Candidatus Woesearchaeota archaeon]